MQHQRAVVVLAVILIARAGWSKAGEPNLNAKPPEGAVVLFDGADVSKLRMKDNSACKWKIVEGALEVTPNTGDIYSDRDFGDCTLHVEFRTPEPAATDKGQHRGNSGMFMQGTYEIQVLESFGLEAGKGDCGAIYNIKAPDQNVARKPGEWQSYDVTYKAPRIDADGKKVSGARITLVWNGVKVHDDVEIPHATRNAKVPEPTRPGPIQLQDHGFAVQYRNIWVVAARSEEPKAAASDKKREIVLFQGKDTSQWTMKDGSPCAWPLQDSAMVAQTADVITKEKFKDFELHVEFWLPESADPTSSNRGKRTNSGIYLQSRYEIQLLDSYGLAPLTYQDSGGIYTQKAPDVNASLPTQRWQTMDFTFRAARYDEAGNKTQKARVSILHNDTPIHKEIEIENASPSGDPEGPEAAPVRLQFHGSAVRFRNIRITPSE